MTKRDTWAEGYQAGLNGQSYYDNPYPDNDGGTAWAFGLSEGLRERNRRALAGLLNAMG